MEPEVKSGDDVAFALEDSIILTTMLEVEGEGQYLPPYAGNLDIMTSAALGAAELIAEQPAEAGVEGVADD